MSARHVPADAVLLLPMKKKLVFALIIILLLGIGFAIGYMKGIYDGAHAGEFGTSLGYASYIGLHGSHSSLQYKTSDYANAHSALIDFAEVLKQGLLKVKDDPLLTEDILYFDIGLTYARLALLEEKQGNNDAMNEYFDKSLEVFKARGYKDYDIDKIRDLVAKIDKESK
jgi:hypothetical protein